MGVVDDSLGLSTDGLRIIDLSTDGLRIRGDFPAARKVGEVGWAAEFLFRGLEFISLNCLRSSTDKSLINHQEKTN